MLTVVAIFSCDDTVLPSFSSAVEISVQLFNFIMPSAVAVSCFFFFFFLPLNINLVCATVAEC